MNMHMLVRDRWEELGGGRYGRWHLVLSGCLEARLEEYNAARAQYLDRVAIIVYDDGRLSVDADGRILNSEYKRLPPGEFIHDPDDPSTWNDYERQQHRRRSFVEDLCYMEVGTEQERDEVIEMAKEHGLNIADLNSLDRLDGGKPEFCDPYIFVDGEEGRWRHKLRELRTLRGWWDMEGAK